MSKLLILYANNASSKNTCEQNLILLLITQVISITTSCRVILSDNLLPASMKILVSSNFSITLLF